MFTSSWKLHISLNYSHMDASNADRRIEKNWIYLLVLCYYLLVLAELLSAVATIVGLMDNAVELIRRRCIGSQ